MQIVGDTVKLSESDAFECQYAAVYCMENYGNPANRTTRYNRTISFHEQISEFAQSLAAELAVANYFKLPIDLFKDKGKRLADVGNQLEIRWTHWADGQLIIYEYDRPTDIAILVTGSHPFYRLAGWMPVAMARKDKFRHHNQPTWWVNQRNLMPIDTLIRSSYGSAISNMSQM